MIINVLMILAFAIGAGSATAEPYGTHKAVDECYINGTWYNPCPPDSATDQPPQDGTPNVNPQ